MLKTLLFLWIALTSCASAVEGMGERRVVQAEAASAGGHNVAGWERYRARGEEFSALFPEVPSTYAVLRPSSANESGRVLEGRGFSSYADDTVLVVISFDNAKAKEPLQTFVDEFGSYGVIRSKLNFSHDVALNNFAGRQYFLKSEHAHGVVQFYLTSKRAYVFAAVTRDEKDSTIQRFLKSLAFYDKNKASDIYESNRLVASATTALASGVGSATQNPNLTIAFNPQEVTSPAVIVTMPQPPYTDGARQQFITGTVILRGVLSSTGQVTNLRAAKGLPFGLTEQALIAAQALKFFPAVKDGRRVSQYVQMEYKFDLY